MTTICADIVLPSHTNFPHKNRISTAGFRDQKIALTLTLNKDLFKLMLEIG